MSEILYNPINELTTGLDPSVELLYGLMAGDVDPHQLGLVRPRENSFADLVHTYTYTQPRVEAFGLNGIEESDIVKVKTMFDLTEEGQQLEDHWNVLRFIGEISVSQKDMSDWRVTGNTMRLVRTMSLDEGTQLIFNVLGQGNKWFENLMPMQLIGAARPVLAREIILRGDNSSDHFNRALAIVAFREGMDSRAEMYKVLGDIYRPGLFTPATAQGHRQLGSTKSYIDWINGILKFDKLSRLRSFRRKAAYTSLMANTVAHILAKTDAA